VLGATAGVVGQFRPKLLKLAAGTDEAGSMCWSTMDFPAVHRTELHYRRKAE
jgi:hypothetical protein